MLIGTPIVFGRHEAETAPGGKGSLTRDEVDAWRQYCTEESLRGIREDPA